VAVCPPFTAIHATAEVLKESRISVGAQNCHWEPQGAYTGAIAAEMVADAGASQVILGHSERRQLFGETDAGVNRRLRAVLRAGLSPIVCVGETLDERERDRTFAVVETQTRGGLADLSTGELASLTLAYEPVWAIGTGHTATPEQAQEVHAHLRGTLLAIFGAEFAKKVRIQYGGSVKPANAAELLSCPDIDGALVGGASLDADSFSGIVHA
jgi:triosephosphate isomerase